MISYSHPVSVDDDVEADADDAARSRTTSRETLVKLSTTVKDGDAIVVSARPRRRVGRVNDDDTDGDLVCDSARARRLETMRRGVRGRARR